MFGMDVIPFLAWKKFFVCGQGTSSNRSRVLRFIVRLEKLKVCFVILFFVGLRNTRIDGYNMSFVIFLGRKRMINKWSFFKLCFQGKKMLLRSAHDVLRRCRSSKYPHFRVSVSLSLTFTLTYSGIRSGIWRVENLCWKKHFLRVPSLTHYSSSIT